MKPLVAFAAIATLMSSAAGAVITVYTSQSAFAAAAGATAIETFGGRPLVTGLTYTSTAGEIYNGRFNDRVVPGGASTTFTFAGGTTAFGANFDETPGGFGTGLAFALNLSGGGMPIPVEQIDGYSGGFYGFISTDRFASVLLTGGTTKSTAETYTLDNLQFGNARAVPEPAAWAMMVVGFGLIGAAARRRSEQVAAG